MISKRCSNVVASRVEQAILDTESRGCGFYFRFWNSPGALAFRTSHGLDDDPVCRAGPPYRRVGRVVKRVYARRAKSPSRNVTDKDGNRRTKQFHIFLPRFFGFGFISLTKEKKPKRFRKKRKARQAVEDIRRKRSSLIQLSQAQSAFRPFVQRTFCLVAVHIDNPDRSPLGIEWLRHVPSPSGFAGYGVTRWGHLDSCLSCRFFFFRNFVASAP